MSRVLVQNIWWVTVFVLILVNIAHYFLTDLMVYGVGSVSPSPSPSINQCPASLWTLSHTLRVAACSSTLHRILAAILSSTACQRVCIMSAGIMPASCLHHGCIMAASWLHHGCIMAASCHHVCLPVCECLCSGADWDSSAFPSQ